MRDRKQSKPKWAEDLNQFQNWEPREFVSALCGLPRDHKFSQPRTHRERKKQNDRALQDELLRARAERHVKDAIRLGKLTVAPSLANQQILEKIKPCVDNPRIFNEIQRAIIVDARHFTEPYYVAREEAIRWATSTGLFSSFPFTLADIHTTESAATPPTEALSLTNNNGSQADRLKRAKWTRDQLNLRKMTISRLRKVGGPDPKSTKKILNAQPVTEPVLGKLLSGLNTEQPPVTRQDIP